MTCSVFRLAPFSVNEGHSRVLVSDYLAIPNRHFDNLNIDIYVIKHPSNGRLESSRDPGNQLHKFPMRLARAEFVYYKHDGSDTLNVSNNAKYICAKRISKENEAAFVS